MSKQKSAFSNSWFATGLFFNVLAMVFVSGAAWAQQDSAEVSRIDEVVVTGSLIRRTEQSSQLVQALDLEDIQFRSATNALEILSTVPTNLSVDQSNTTAGFGGGLVNFANLRALGAENTLVLVNGKRVVRSPIRDRSVNLNTIPLALVESVDVLADGASSIYGTDAVAGVINFRIKQQFEGVEYYIHTTQPEADGGETNAGSLTAGIGSLAEDGWNVFIGGTWRERKEINTLERSFSARDYIPERGLSQIRVRSFPSNIAQFDPVTGAEVTPNSNPFPECDPPASIPSGQVGQPPGACAADFAAMGWAEILNPEEQWSVMARGSVSFGENRASLEYFQAESDISSAIAPTIFGGSAYQVPTNSPFFPGAGTTPAIPGWDPTIPGTIVNVTFTPAGRRTTQSVANTDRILGEISGDIGGFGYEFWGLYSTSDNDLRPTQGALDNQGLIDGLAGTNGAPFLNPFGDQTPEGADYLESLQYRQPLRSTKSELTMFGLTLSRDLMELTGGSLTGALAFEYGDESAEFRFLPSPQLAGVVVGRDPENSGSRDRYSVAAEVLVPIVESLEVNASLRYDDYSDFGDTTNPKVLLSWFATNSVNLHASYNTGFRAPTLYQLNQPQALGFQQQLFNDPILCPGGMVDTTAGGIAIRDCLAQYNVVTGGNPLLQPEESTAYTAGFDINVPQETLAFGTLSFGLDYWDYEIESVIGPITPTAIFNDPVRFESLLVRCDEGDPNFVPSTETCGLSTAGNPIAYISQVPQNLGITQTSGIDVHINWNNENGLGVFSFNYRASIVDEYEFQRIPGDPFVSRAGVYVDGFPVFEYSHYLTLSWQRDRFSAQLQNQHKDGYVDCNQECRVAPGFENVVDSYNVTNLIGTYEFTDWLALTLHVNNLFDEDPPFSNASGGEVCGGCDTRFADPTGRAIGVTLRGSFEAF